MTSQDRKEAITGANVLITGLNLSVFTSDRGVYVLTVPAARMPSTPVTVTARGIGFKSMSRTLTLQAGEQTADFVLGTDINRLEEIIVTGALEGVERAKVPFAVARLTAEDLPVVSNDPLRTLMGKVAGVRIAQTTGRAGTAPEILIRGPRSINALNRGQEPLIIVDGVIASHVGSIQELGGLDIETVEVVKGAAGSSLYGAQAANGVITITTKRGGKNQEGVIFTARTEVGFSDWNSIDFGIPVNHNLQLDETGKRWCIIASSGSSGCSRTFDLNREMLRIHNVNADTLRTGHNPLLASLGTDDLKNITQSQIYPGRYYNGLAQIAARPLTSLSSVDATGKIGSVGFYVSGQYTDDPGVLKLYGGSTQRRGRVNLDYNARSDLRIQVSTMFDNFYRDSRNAGIFGTLLRGQLPGLDLLARDTLGRLLLQRQNFRATDNGNGFPMYQSENEVSDRTVNRFLGSIGVKYYPASWITVEGNFGYDNRALNDNFLRKKGYRSVGISTANNNGRQEIETSRDEAVNTGLSATLRHQLASRLTAKLRLATHYDQEKFITSRGTGQVYQVKNVYQLSNTSTNFTSGSSSQVIKQAGFSAAGTLDYKDRYVLDGSYRYDGSSLFGPGNRWAPFDRLAGVWIVSNEPFWNVPFLNELRFRVSRGTAGSTPNFSAQYEVFNVSQTGISTGQAGNAALRPETTKEYELGTDFTLFKRLGFEVTYAQSNTYDQIIPADIPASVGYSSQWLNAGTLQNKTWEVGVTVPIVNSRSLYWQARATWDRTRTMITKLNVPAFTSGGGTAQGTGTFFYMTDDKRRTCLPGEVGHLPGEAGYGPGEARPNCTGLPLNRYGNMYGRVFFQSCNQLQVDLRSRCGEGKDFQLNDKGWLVWVGAGNSWRDGVTKNLWQTRLPASESPWGTELNWGHPIVDRPLRGQPGEGVGINQVIGNVFPLYRFSISNDFSYKKLTLYALLDASIGNSIYNQGEGWALLSIGSGEFDQAKNTVETAKPVGYSWRAGSPENIGTGGFYDVLGPNNYVVEKGSYAKLREISLSYKLGPIGRVGDWTVGIVGRNIHTFTNYSGYDPEIGCGGRDGSGCGGAGAGNSGSGLINQTDAFSTPTLRTWTFSLSTRF